MYHSNEAHSSVSPRQFYACWQTLERGYENSQRLDGAVIMAVVGMRIYPGTALFDQALAENGGFCGALFFDRTNAPARIKPKKR